MPPKVIAACSGLCSIARNLPATADQPYRGEQAMFRLLNDRISRRDLLKFSAAGLCASSSIWFDLLARRAGAAETQGLKPKSCILLWMGGGPAQSHTWDLKRDGPYQPIATSVPGIQISEHLPQVAKQ